MNAEKARNDYRHILNHMKDAACMAGRIILDIYADDFQIVEKADHSPVTEADQLAEEQIIAILKDHYPDIPIIAEESCAAGRAPTNLGARFFMVDPLDGTREFVARNGEFTVNIALIEQGRPILGVIVAPCLRKMWFGSPEGTFEATLDTDLDPIEQQQIFARPQPQIPVIAISRSHLSQQTRDWLEDYNYNNCQAIGSSLKFCLLASGQADIYPRMEHCMEWDTAAGDAILTSAGGHIADLDGKPLIYGKTGRGTQKDYLQDFFIARGAPCTFIED